MILSVSMLALLIAFFALFIGLVRFAENVIRPRSETAFATDGALSELPDPGTVPGPPSVQPG